MKKIIIAVLALLSIGVAEAQLQVTHLPKAETVCKPFSNMWLKKDMMNGEMQYYIVGSTTNQFDKPILLFLGNLDKAKTSLSQLLTDLYIVGEQYELIDSCGVKFWAYAQNEFGTKRYAIKQNGYAGYMYLPLSGIRKMLSALELE